MELLSSHLGDQMRSRCRKAGIENALIREDSILINLNWKDPNASMHP